jgi:hypothetical protein
MNPIVLSSDSNCHCTSISTSQWNTRTFDYSTVTPTSNIPSPDSDTGCPDMVSWSFSVHTWSVKILHWTRPSFGSFHILSNSLFGNHPIMLHCTSSGTGSATKQKGHINGELCCQKGLICSKPFQQNGYSRGRQEGSSHKPQQVQCSAVKQRASAFNCFSLQWLWERSKMSPATHYSYSCML